MFGMSVNEVPGWSVTIAPSGIGVPVAFTPGLGPHCDVLAVVPSGFDGESPVEVPLLELLPQAERTVAPMTASIKAARAPGTRLYVPIATPGNTADTRPVRARLADSRTRPARGAGKANRSQRLGTDPAVTPR